MNKTLAFLFVLAMTAAGMFAVKWQNAVTQMELAARKAERESPVVVAPPPSNQRGLQEVQRLEGELQNLRLQWANQRELDAVAHQHEIEILMQENQSLQTLLSNQLHLAKVAPPIPAAPKVEVIEPLPEVPVQENAAGLIVVDMYQFRELNWRQGTMPASGAAVISVDPGSPAMIAGIQVGDIVLSLGKTTIDGPGTFNETMAQLLPGSATQVVLNRNRSEIVVMLLKPIK